MGRLFFFIDKATDNLKSYQIVNDRTDEQINSATEKINGDPDCNYKAVEILDKHVIAAINKKEDYDSIKSLSIRVRETFSELRDDIQTDLRGISNEIDDMVDLINKAIATQPQTKADNSPTSQPSAA